MDTSALPHTSALHLHSIMFLFQCNVCIQSQYHVLKFTFHYVSISMLTGNAVSSKDIHLHSIMFLFQWQVPIARYPFRNRIYIPLCFYFNGDHPGAWLHRWSFTFHYVSISIDLRSNPATSCCNLHSIMFLFQSFLYACGAQTIWFTFHYVSISINLLPAVLIQLHDLHSIMFLFQFHTFQDAAFCMNIYIPLCFYFNLHLKRIAVEHIIIYIPLCFYFNSVCVAGLTPISPFTFHYVSISIHTQTLAQRLTVIYIPLCFYFNKYDTKPPTLYLSHLHSIMFLFQYLISACNAVAQFNLHSIMFLFQSDSSAFCSALALFTFHYVSISIYTGCVIF